MCGRFYIDTDDMSDAELLALLDRENTQRETPRLVQGEVRPGDCAAVIAMNRSLRRSAFVMEWGFTFGKQRIINARSETAADKPAFSQSVRDRRCLIPASAYFEWDHRSKPYEKYSFYSAQREPLYLAGLYRFEQNSPLPHFTILTRQAALDIACFHDRMPVIIPARMKDTWLDRDQPFEILLNSAVTQVMWHKSA